MNTTLPAPHAPVMVNEALAALALRADGCYVDATFGRGGHSRAILDRLGPQGRLWAIDRDPQAVAWGRANFSDARLTLLHGAFGQLQALLDAHAAPALDGVLMDLGVSSPQLDDAARGMSFRFDAPLDMRMDTSKGETAAQWLARADQGEIREVINDYGEERFAHAIAKAVVAARLEQGISSTGQLAALVASVVRTREPGKHPATRTFQALRIFINRELEELSLALPQAQSRLRAQGRLVVISFHSLEDRIVKRFMRDAAAPPQPPRKLPLRADQLPPPQMRLAGKAQRPTAAEIEANARARSAVLRAAIKLAEG